MAGSKWKKTALEATRPPANGKVLVSEQANPWAASVAKETPPAVQVEPLLVSEKMAALMLGLSRRTVFALNKQGVLFARKIGNRKLYSVESLKTFAEAGAA
jgi:hypothetical protein